MVEQTPVSDHSMTPQDQLVYHNGFGNHVESEAIPGALPKGQNNPQKCPMGLYAEQLSGTPFTYGKHKNKRTWLYRVLPSVVHDDWYPSRHAPRWITDWTVKDPEQVISPEQLRWPPCDEIREKFFIDSIASMCGAGSPLMKEGISISVYGFSHSMSEELLVCYSADSDMLIVP